MRRHLVLCAAVLTVAGCYRITVLHGTQPPAAEATVVEYPWQHSWVFGLVPPSEINVGERCPAGVSKVETRVSFLNGLASTLVGIAGAELSRQNNDSLYFGSALGGIWQPMSAKITCAPR
jgi:Bor protein